ncbi:MAG: hypothetical protein ACRDP3_12190 [Streptomyces sp.]|uniref:hypothetical protein n=1 Tax=Streptomyces sp. TaxID=1931 RepID=UPI003D6B1606
MAPHTNPQTVPENVAAAAAERSLGRFIMMREDRSALTRIMPSVIIIGLLIGGIYLVGGVVGVKVGLVPFLAVPVVLLYVVSVALGAVFSGRRTLYLFELGLVSRRRRRTEAVAWSEVSRLEVSEGDNLLGPVNGWLRRIGLRTGNYLGTTADVWLRDHRDLPRFDAEYDGDEPFRAALFERVQAAGIAITFRGR